MKHVTREQKIADLEVRLRAMHEYSRRLTTIALCHEQLLKIVFDRLGLDWQAVELPPPPPVN